MLTLHIADSSNRTTAQHLPPKLLLPSKRTTRRKPNHNTATNHPPLFLNKGNLSSNTSSTNNSRVTALDEQEWRQHTRATADPHHRIMASLPLHLSKT